VNPILMQTISYTVVLVIALLIISFLQKGFFWAYLRVRASFGTLVLVKVRAVNRDYFRIGKIEESFLVFKGTSGDRRLSIPSHDVFYRCLAIAWIDVDDTKGAIMKPSYEAVGGFDSEKHNSLYVRALYRPSILGTRENFIIGGIIIIIIVLAVVLWFLYSQSKDVTTIQQLLQQGFQGIRSTSIQASTGL
jgi:hypothetical protein